MYEVHSVRFLQVFLGIGSFIMQEHQLIWKKQYQLSKKQYQLSMVKATIIKLIEKVKENEQ